MLPGSSLPDEFPREGVLPPVERLHAAARPSRGARPGRALAKGLCLQRHGRRTAIRAHASARSASPPGRPRARSRRADASCCAPPAWRWRASSASAGPSRIPTATSARASSTELKRRSRSPGANLVACDDELKPRQERNLEAGARRAGDRPHGDHPRHLRRPRPLGRGQAAGRAGPARVQPRAHARAVDPPRAARRGAYGRRHRHAGARARRRSRPTAASLATGSPRCGGGSRTRRARAPRCAPSASAPRCRRWRWPATRTPASRRCSTRSPAPRSGVRDRLFHTLDPTTRSFEITGRTYLLTDTVGFIRKLPHQLVDAFSATLEEALGADLIVHVADASAPEDELHEMLSAVDDVLAEIGAGERPRLLALNKVDLLDAERRRELSFRFPRAVQVSAVDGRGPRGAARGDRGALPRRARADGAARAVRRGRARCRSCTSWRASSSARTQPRACAWARRARRGGAPLRALLAQRPLAAGEYPRFSVSPGRASTARSRRDEQLVQVGDRRSRRDPGRPRWRAGATYQSTSPSSAARASRRSALSARRRRRGSPS